MRKRVRLAVVRVAVLAEEFSWEEIEEAIRYVREHDVRTRLIKYLVDGAIPEEGTAAERPAAGRKVDAPTLPSAGVAALAHADYGSFALVSQFERLAWQREILPRFADLREFGRAIDPQFRAVGDTAATIAELVELVLANITPPVKTLLEKVITSEPWQDDGAGEPVAAGAADGGDAAAR